MPDPSEPFLPGTNDAGMPRSAEAIFRAGVPPHCGQSRAADMAAHPNAKITKAAIQLARNATDVSIFPEGVLWRQEKIRIYF